MLFSSKFFDVNDAWKGIRFEIALNGPYGLGVSNGRVRPHFDGFKLEEIILYTYKNQNTYPL